MSLLAAWAVTVRQTMRAMRSSRALMTGFLLMIVVLVGGAYTITYNVTLNRQLIHRINDETCNTDHKIAEALRRQGRTLVAAARAAPTTAPGAEQRIADYLKLVERDASEIDCTVSP